MKPVTARARAGLAAVVFVLLCAVQVSTAPKNFIWKATNRQGVTVYLAGSVHLLTKEFYPLDPAFEKALESSDLLIEELELGEIDRKSIRLNSSHANISYAVFC